MYGAIFSSFELNYIIKWQLKKRTELYFVYSVFRGVSGVKFNNIKSFFNYKANDKTEIFYDQSFVVKLDFYLK